MAALVREHGHHPASRPWFRGVIDGKCQGGICVHTLAELYATMTAMPLRPQPSTQEVEQLLRTSVLAHFQTVELRSRDHSEALHDCSGNLLRSGAVFDALIARAVSKLRAHSIVTLNRAHFVRFLPPEQVLDPRRDPLPDW